MKLQSSRRAFLVTALLSGVFSGCLGRPALQVRTFALAVPPPARRGGEAPPAGVLWVRPVRVAAAFDSRAFVVRRAESEYVADPYNGFLVSPGPMLTELVAGWIQGLEVFRSVVTGGSQVSPSHALEVEVTELVADYREPSAPTAVLALTARLLHPLAGPPAQQWRWQRELRKRVPIAKAAPTELVAGWNRALSEILSSLSADLQQRPPPPPIDAPQA